jgi:WD40 repeat protein
LAANESGGDSTKVNTQVRRVEPVMLWAAWRSIVLLAMLLSVCCYPASAQQQTSVPAVSVTTQGAVTQTRTTQDPGSGPCPPLSVQAGDHIRALGFSPDGQWLATAAEDYSLAANEGRNHITIWNTATGKLEHRWNTGRLVEQVAFNPNGNQLASYNQNGKIEVRDFRKDIILYTLTGGPLAYSSDGKILAIGGHHTVAKSERNQSGDSGYRTVEIHDAATGKVLRTIDISQFNIYSLAISRDGILFVGSCNDDDTCDGTVGAWNLASGKFLKSYDFEASQFSPDGRWAGVISQSGDSGEVKVMDLAANTVKWSFGGATATFSPDWKEVALREKSVIHLNSLATGNEIQTVPSGGGPVAFSPDGKRLAAANYSSQTQRPITCSSQRWTITTSHSLLKIWDVATSRELLTLGNPTSDNNPKQ